MNKIFTVKFPDIGEGVVEGEVVEWRKNVGDTLKQDEPVVVVMTDKATVELPSPHPGILAKQYYPLGGIAIKDQPLYDITLDEHADTIPPTENVEVPVSDIKSKLFIAPVKSDYRNTVEGKSLATPKVRGIAKQLGIPLTNIYGTGSEGRITLQDLTQFSKMEESTPFWNLPGDEVVPLIGIKALMAKRMAESKSQIPHFSYFEQADATRLIQLKGNIKAKASNTGMHVTYMPFILKALSLCIHKFPLINSSFDKKTSKVIIHHQQNIGIAVATPLGLIVPVLKEIEKLTIEPLIRSYEELIHRAHTGKLAPSDMKEATFTISNFGSHGGHGLWATPVINFPEVAILAIGKIHQQAIVKNSQIVIRDLINLSWSFDHRIIDGELAARISQYLCSLLENPAALL